MQYTKLGENEKKSGGGFVVAGPLSAGEFGVEKGIEFLELAGTGIQRGFHAFDSRREADEDKRSDECGDDPSDQDQSETNRGNTQILGDHSMPPILFRSMPRSRDRVISQRRTHRIHLRII
jgi:hypothetical protein